MPLFKISATIHYWPGSVEDHEAKTFEIDEEFVTNSESAACLELDRLIFNKKAELQRKGFRTRHSDWRVGGKK